LPLLQQLTSCWGLRERVEVTELSTFIKYMLSIASVAAKAQHDPAIKEWGIIRPTRVCY
jgi:pterin-4a-carbinolamine dehydratase